MYALAGIVLWLIIFIGCVVIAGSSPLLLFDVPSFLIVTGFDLTALLVSGTFADFAHGMKQLFKKETVLTKDELLGAASAFGLMNVCSIYGGILGAVMGLVLMLASVMTPEQIGPFMAVALITIVYGLSLSIMIFLPGRSRFIKMAGLMQNRA